MNMKLREKQSQLDFLNEIAHDEHDEIEMALDNDDEYDDVPKKPKPKTKAKSKQEKRSHKKKIAKPEFFDLVLGTLARADVFDDASLKALRLCSKSVKLLVDQANVLTKFTFRGTKGKHGFSVFLVHPDAMNHVQTLTLDGKMELRSVTRFVLAPPPALRKLRLEKCGEAVEVLLCGNYPLLTSLELTETPRNCDISSLLKESAWPLVELSLDGCTGKYKTFAEALVQFSSLRKLTLTYLPNFSGDAVGATDLQGALPHLEELSVAVANPHNFGLFHAEGAQLPSIHTFTCNAIDDPNAFLAHCPWLKNVIELQLWGRNYYGAVRSIDDVLINLDGGAVEKLEVSQWHVDATTISRLELPCLRKLDLTINNAPETNREGDILAMLKFPRLEKLSLTANRHGGQGNNALRISATSRGMKAFAAAHPLLREFSISGVSCSAAALQELSAKLAPRLEELTLDKVTVAEVDLVAALLAGVHSAKSSTEATARTGESNDDGGDGDGDIAVAWPALRGLAFVTTRVTELQKHVLALAPLCPYLTNLSLHEEGAGLPRVEDVQTFASSATEINAWPDLRRLSGGMAYGHERLSLLERVWPKASISR